MPPTEDMEDNITTPAELSYYYTRCSICFDQRFRIVLNKCHDQFCLSCFTRYISEVISSSWGLGVTSIKCPVCQHEIPKQEWTQYVPLHVIANYEKFNQPYQRYKTSCFNCQSELVPCDSELFICPRNPTLFCDTINHALENCKQKNHAHHNDHIALKRWITVYKRHKWDEEMDTLGFYHQIMSDAFIFSRSHSDQTAAYEVSHIFTRLLIKPEVWKKLQFAHIKNFSSMQCMKCTSSVCLLCGIEAHDNSCQSNMEVLVKSKNISSENQKTMEWKLAHCRQCPVCSILINREEGCNKVDCPFCGYTFCWECQSPWSEGCAFYRCSTLPGSNTMPKDNTEEKTEIGVPDISKIKERFIQM